MLYIPRQFHEKCPTLQQGHGNIDMILEEVNNVSSKLFYFDLEYTHKLPFIEDATSFLMNLSSPRNFS